MIGNLDPKWQRTVVVVVAVVVWTRFNGGHQWYVHQRLRLIGNEPWHSTPKRSSKIDVKAEKPFNPIAINTAIRVAWSQGRPHPLRSAPAAPPNRLLHVLDPERAQKRARQ